MLAWHKDVPLIVSEDGFIMQQVWTYWTSNNGRVTKTSNEILTSETVRGVISVLRSLLCALLFNWVIGRETKAGGNLRSRSLLHFPYLLRAWKQSHLSDRKDILVKSCEVWFYKQMPDHMVLMRHLIVLDMCKNVWHINQSHSFKK